ncbi:MAG TPA: hypothetical protein VJV78_31180 [Polyangiales bacterium]|nr:hypothetical protein [Polyangiales bacterium]
MKRRPAVLLALLVSFLLLSWWLALDAPDAVEDPLAAAEPPPPPPAAGAQTVPVSKSEPVPESPSQPSPPSAAPPPPQAPEAPIPPDTRGFVDALQGRFDNDPRDSAAGESENALRKYYRGPRMPAGLLRSVICRQSVCKLDLHWTAEHDEAYRDAIEFLADGNAKMVATRAAAPDKHGAVEVEAYWVRRPL